MSNLEQLQNEACEKADWYLQQILSQYARIKDAEKEEAERINGASEKEYNVGGFWSGFTLKDTYANRPDTLAQVQQRRDKLEMHIKDFQDFLKQELKNAVQTAFKETSVEEKNMAFEITPFIAKYGVKRVEDYRVGFNEALSDTKIKQTEFLNN
tara:strand:- start:8552 stop:9013 length:462 start_codon:yes stop_codon:yes gene_type:complete